MKQHQKLRHNVLHLIGDKHLTTEKFDLVALHLKVIFDLRKIQHPSQVERIVHIQMDPEQGIFPHRIQALVEG